MKSIITIMLLSLFCFSSCTMSTLEETDIEVGENRLGQVRVLWTEDPSSHAIISWTTNYSSDVNVVIFNSGNSRVVHPEMKLEINAKVNGLITMNKYDRQAGVPESYYHHAELTGLKPSTRYNFRVCSDDGCSDSFYFITAPLNNSNISFIAGGDSRTATYQSASEAEVPHTDRQMMNRLISNIISEEPEILAFVHGADYAWSAEWRYLYYWFEDLKYSYGGDGRILPLVVSQGNHDLEIGFSENFWLGNLPEKNREGCYYVTKFSKDVALITLNTEISMAGDQRVWLEDNIRKQRKNKWLFVQYHKPAYPAVKDFYREDFTKVRNLWVPIFEEYRVDMAIESDGHSLKRTLPILKGQPDPAGIIYIGEGGLGVPQRDAIPNLWYLRGEGMSASAHHIWRIDITDSVTNVSAIGMDREILTNFKIKSKR